jgi:hypothetical protein
MVLSRFSHVVSVDAGIVDPSVWGVVARLNSLPPPKRPCGLVIIIITKSNEYITILYCDTLLKASGKIVNSVAERITPIMLPIPPIITITTISKDFRNPNCMGFKYVTKCPYSPPAIPAKNAPVTKATTFTRVELTPIASAAISSSRTAKNDFP